MKKIILDGDNFRVVDREEKKVVTETEAKDQVDYDLEKEKSSEYDH